MELKDYLKLMVKNEASDLYLTTEAAPCLKIHGHIRNIGESVLAPGRVRRIAYDILSDEQIQEFQNHPEMNLGLSEPGIGRFRVNIYLQRNEVAMVIRHIKTEIPSIESLGLPPILKKIIMEKRGLVLIVGATSSGKSTSLASMIDYRNSTIDGHIISIEDPIEYVHSHNKSIISQREIGIDTNCYEDALKNTLRQAPDVILIGEIRTQETMEHAITFAETGHLCLSTLHASNSEQALDRIIHFFPSDRRDQLLLDLSLNLVAIICQRLIPSLDRKRIVAVEVLLGTPLVHDLIKRGEIGELKEIMEKSENLGMKSFDSAIYDLYKENKISQDEALAYADSKNNLRLRISLKEGLNPEKSSPTEGLTLQEKKLKDGGRHHPGEFLSGNDK